MAASTCTSAKHEDFCFIPPASHPAPLPHRWVRRSDTKQKLPQTRVAYISTAGNPARWSQVERVREANRRIEALTKTDPQLAFINVFTAMLGPDGLPKPDIFVADKLHMNEQGYAIWKEVVGPFLK